MLINVKMPTIVGILTFISMINTRPESLKARNVFISKLVEWSMKKNFLWKHCNTIIFFPGRQRKWFGINEARDYLSHKPVQATYLEHLKKDLNGLVK